MKKCLALLLLLALLCPGAQAETLPYPTETVLSVLDLTPEQRALADFLYGPVFRGDAEIALPRGTRYADVSAAMNCLMQDYPELFHLGKHYSIQYFRSAPEMAISITPTYRMDAQSAAELRRQLYIRASLLASRLDAQGLHDELVSSVVYGGDDELRHTAVGALLQGEATCEGYAQALTLLYRMAGIPCGVVSGTAVNSADATERHSWNIARLTGYTLIDPTWNDQGRLRLNTCWYYGLSTWQMGVDHFPDEGQILPFCGEQDNWHAQHGTVVTTLAEADAALRRLVAGESLNLRVVDAALYRTLAQDTVDYLGGYNERYPQEAFYGAYSVVRSDAQQCVIIMRGGE